jgi:hypothetical protein
MRPVQQVPLHDNGTLVLLTVEEVEPNVEALAADFRDTHALFYVPLNAWMGVSLTGTYLGTGTPEMRDGIWYVARDEELCALHRNVEPKPDHIMLRRLP